KLDKGLSAMPVPPIRPPQRSQSIPRALRLRGLAAVALWITFPTWAPPSACAEGGTTFDFAYHDGTALRPGQAQAGRAYVPGAVGESARVPFVVFLHGMNSRGLKNMWLGDGVKDDLRQVVDDLLDEHRTAPLILAGPSQTRDAGSSLKLWLDFD